MNKITHRQVKMIVKVFPPNDDGYIKSVIANSLEECKDRLENYLDTYTTPGTRVIHLQTHYVPLAIGDDV